MRKTLLSCLFVSLFATSAFADYKAGQAVGVRKCTAKGAGHYVDVTSKRTVGPASCKTEIGKKLKEKGACDGKEKNAKVTYDFEFGRDSDPNQAKGEGFFLCR
jgi:hypothetical protein